MKQTLVLAIMLFSFLAASVPPSLLAAPKKSSSSSVKKGKKAKKKASAGADYSPLNFLPFGIGHFSQGRYVMGGLLGGSQAMMLYLYMDRKSQIDSSNKDAAATIAEIEESGVPPEAEVSDYLTRNADYVKKTNSEATLCLVGFLGLYAVGTIDAVWDPFGSRSARSKKMSDIELMDEDASKWAAEKTLDLSITKPRLSVFALPTTQQAKGSFGFSLEKSFR